jgi:hypothetical protein
MNTKVEFEASQSNFSGLSKMNLPQCDAKSLRALLAHPSEKRSKTMKPSQSHLPPSFQLIETRTIVL